MKTENMTFSEALEAMKQGYKVKRASWSVGYIYLKNTNIVIDDCDNGFESVSIDYIFATDWEIYNEPKPEPQFEIGELVMMRNEDDEFWQPAHFGLYDKKSSHPYQSFIRCYKQCAKFDKEIVFTNKPAKL